MLDVLPAHFGELHRMTFQGSLAVINLPDIIQLIGATGKTGVFYLVDGSHKGQIYLHDGKIVHAEIEDIFGEEAVYTLAIWSQGEFQFEQGISVGHRTISKSNTNLLMEAARRLDEWRVLSKKIPAITLIPEFVVLENREGQINLNTSEWLILSKIDGRRSVKELAVASGMSIFDAAKILYGLIATGLIRLKDPAGRPAPRVPTAGAVLTAVKKGVSSPPSSLPVDTLLSDLLSKLNRIRDACHASLGNVGESVVNKHYQRARGELERGAGWEVVEEAIAQIVRAASILKGPSTSETLSERIKTIK